MSHKIEHKFFIPRWQLDLAKYQFAHTNKIKGFRPGKIDKGVMAIIDIRYKDQIFNQMVEECLKHELVRINSSNPVESYVRSDIKGSDDKEGWDVTVILDLKNPPQETSSSEDERNFEESKQED
jgi:FKBP-type peptidyl-prolyl cis-trans isomerase (trigger factor)